MREAGQIESVSEYAARAISDRALRERQAAELLADSRAYWSDDEIAQAEAWSYRLFGVEPPAQEGT